MSMNVGEGVVPIRGDFTPLEQGAKKSGKKVTDDLAKEIDGGLKGQQGPLGKTGQGIGESVGGGFLHGFRGKLDQTSGLLQSTGKNMVQTGSMMTLGLTAPLAVGFKKLFDSASDLNEAVNVTGLVFKDQAGVIDEFSKNAAKSIGQSERAAREATASFGGLLNNMGFGVEQSAAFSQQLTVLSSDLASAFNKKPEEAVLALGSALRGESEPIRQFNVMLSEAAIQAEALRLGIAQAPVDMRKVAMAQNDVNQATKEANEARKTYGEGSKEAIDAADKLTASEIKLEKAMEGSAVTLTQNQKAQATMSLIMQQTKDVQGDFANTSEGAANKSRILSAEFENMSAKLGEQLLPIGLKIMGWIGNLLDGFTKLSPKTQTMVLIFAGMLAAVGPLTTVIGGLVAAVGFLITPVGLVVVGIGALIAAATYAYFRFDAFREIVDTVWRFLKDNFVSVLLALLGPIGLVAGAVVYAYNHFTIFRTTVDAVIKAVAAGAKWLWETILQPVFAGIAWSITNVVLPVLDRFRGFVVDFVGPLVAAVFTDVVAPAIGFLVHQTQTMWNTVQPILQAVIDFVRDKLGPVWDGMRMVAEVAFQKLPGIIASALRTAGGIVAGFLDGVGSIADAIGLDDIAKVLRSGATSARGWGQGPAATGQGNGGIAVVGGIRRAMGGVIPGNHNRDDVPIYATPGEYVIKKDSVRKYGLGFMEALNAGHFAKGGLIPNPLDTLRGLADGVIDKARSLGTAALERVWPMLGVPNNITGIPPGGANYLRGGVLSLIRRKESEMGNLSGGGFSRAGGGGPPGAYTAGMLRARAGIQALFGPLGFGGYANRNIAGTGQKSMHALYRAWDIMVGLGNVAKGNAIARWLIDNASSIGLKGIIWNAQKNYGSGWGPYRHPGGGTSPTLLHKDHLHADFFGKGGLVAPTIHKVPWDSGGVAAPGWNLFNNATGAPEPLTPRGSAPVIGVVNVYDDTDADAMIRRLEFTLAGGGF